MKSSELLFMKITVTLYELFIIAGCTPINMQISGRPPPQPILFNTNSFTPYDNFQKPMNIYQSRPEVYFDFSLSHVRKNPPKPPMEQQDHIMQQNYPVIPPQPNINNIIVKESNRGFKNAPNSFPQLKDFEEKYKKHTDSGDKDFKKEPETSATEHFTTDYYYTTDIDTTATTDNYDSSTTDDYDFSLRIGVPGAVAASLLG